MQTVEDDADKWRHLVAVKITIADVICLKENLLLEANRGVNIERSCSSGVWDMFTTSPLQQFCCVWL